MIKDKRIEKIKKHYDILINHKKVKIMNFIISQTPYHRIRLLTKVGGQEFPRPFAQIEIVTDESCMTIQGKWKSLSKSPTLEDCEYEIVEYKEQPRVT